MDYQLINWSFLRKGISILLLIGVLAFSAVGDSWSGVSALANGAAVHCKVMLLGDSITVGKSSGVSDSTKWIGFRKNLWETLNINGYSVDFVGTQTNGEFYSGFDPHHEGYGGWSDSQIATNIYNNGGENWLSQNPADVILLHIGTNDFHNDADDVADILEEIDQFENNTGSRIIVIVARIIETMTNNLDVNTFNNNVVNMIGLRGDSDIYIVDMQSGASLIYLEQPGGDMWDNLHPYHTGYTKMANVWYLKYDEIISVATPNIAPDVTNPGTRNNAEDDQVSLQISASDPDGNDVNYAAYELPPGLSIDSSGEITGKISKAASNGSPYEVRVVVTDGNMCGSASVSFTWNIDKVNESPEIVQPDPQTNYEGENVYLQIVASDQDQDILNYSAAGLPGGLSINQSGAISGTISHSAAENSPYFVEITVWEDGNPISNDSKSFSWTIYDGAPLVVNPGDQLDRIGDDVSLQIIASDPDGDDIGFIAENLPPNLVINPASGEITGEIAEWAFLNNPFNITVTVTDDSEPPQRSEVNYYWMISQGEIYLPLVIH